jgi:type II secretory pathway predicted ATPase ExeA
VRRSGGGKVQAMLHAILDDASRLIPHAQFYASQDLDVSLDCLRQAVAARGVPVRLYMDNGRTYRSPQLARIAASVGMLIVHTPPYQPEGRGKIERFSRSCREQFLNNLDRKQTLSLDELSERLWAWLDSYHRTEHSNLGTTPLLRWQRDIEHIRHSPPATDFRRLFFHRLDRLVRCDGTFQLQNRFYEAPPHLAGQTIEARFDPLDPASVEIYFQGQPQGIARVVDPVVNAQLPSAKPSPAAEPEPTGINFVELLKKKKDEEEPPMVEAFFGFKKTPLSDSPDAKQLFTSQAWNQVKARLQFLVDHHGAGLLTGEVGAGKSTAARTFTAGLNPNPYKILYLHRTSGSALALLRQIALELGPEPAHYRGDLVRQISESTVHLNQSKKQHPILICDEAQLLHHPALEQLPLLLNFDMDSSHYLTLLPIGEPLLRRTLSLQMHEPLRQRIAVQYHLDGITREELDAYLVQQLKAAGIGQPLFDDTARQALYQATKGILRQVNKLALTALRLAAARKLQTVNEAVLLDATSEALL